MSDVPEFGGFYRATILPLRRYLARLLRCSHEAQDVAHDAYRQVFRAMEAERVQKPRAFLYTTARRMAVRHLRRRQRGPVQPAESNVIDLASCQGPGVPQLVSARQEWEAVLRAIGELPPGCRSVLQLSHRDGLSHPEIAARLGIAVSTVEKQHARALRLLRARLEDQGAAATRTTPKEATS